MKKHLVTLLVFMLAFGQSIAFAMEVNGQLKGALLEKLGSDPTGTEARVYYNTGSKVPRFYDGTSWTTLGGLTNPMDSAGDLIYGGASGVPTKFDSGSSGNVLVSGGAGAPSWTNTFANATIYSNTVAITSGLSQTGGSFGSAARSVNIAPVADSSSVYGGIVWNPTGDGITPSTEGWGLYGITSSGARTLAISYDAATAFQFGIGNVGGSSIAGIKAIGTSTARSGGVKLESSDASIKLSIYGATSDSATSPFSINTESNHGIRVNVNNGTEAVEFTSSGQSKFKVIQATTNPESSTGTINALTVTGSLMRFNTAGAITLNGITAPANGEGTILYIQNDTGSTITFSNSSGSASAANQIVNPNAGSIAISNGHMAHLIYSGSRWRMVSPRS